MLKNWNGVERLTVSVDDKNQGSSLRWLAKDSWTPRRFSCMRQSWIAPTNDATQEEPTPQQGRSSVRSQKRHLAMSGLLLIVMTAMLSSCTEGRVALSSGPSKPVRSFAVPSDGKYRVDYDLRGCMGTTISIWNTTVGGVDLSRPNETGIVTADKPHQNGSTKVSLSYGTWQVDDTKGKPAGCTWTIALTPVLF